MNSPATNEDGAFEDFLRRERTKDLLRITTAGSVDDGKSTLIGRLLYDTQSVYEDQLQAIAGRGTTANDVLDLALLTDGLNAEREQGITIDVAYRHLSTARRRYLLADTPGHVQYTRNMVTGASTADAAVLLLDVRKGVLPQSIRHACIAALLGVRNIVIAVNKMDLVDYAETPFRECERSFRAAFATLPFAARTRLHFIPVSALAGENVARASPAMPWYTGPSVLALLDDIPALEQAAVGPFRMAVQRVVRPDSTFRGFAGQIASGSVRVGQPVLLLPSRVTNRIARIVTYDGDLEQAAAPLSVTLTLEEEADLGRGDLLADPAQPPTLTSSFNASLVWMDDRPLDPERRYLLKHTTRTQPAYVRLQPGSRDLAGGDDTGDRLGLNGIRNVAIRTLAPLLLDPYAEDRATGSFILIDPESNATIAAGMVSTLAPAEQTGPGRVTPEERRARFGHAAAVVTLHGPPAFLQAVERVLFDLGANVVEALRNEADACLRSGALVLVQSQADDRSGLRVVIAGRESEIAESQTQAAAQAVLHALRDVGILP